MAIGQHGYYRQYQTRALWSIAALQMTGAAIAAFVGWWVWQTSGGNAVLGGLWMGACLLILNTLGGILIFKILSKPHKLLAQAVAHVSKDPVVTEPPRLGKKDGYSGLTAMVQTIYDLAVNPPKQDTPAANIALLEALTADAPCGLVALDQNNAIIYANTAAPVHDAPNGKKELGLMFDQSDSLASWFQKASANKVRDTHTWQRIADAIPGTAHRRIFDVAAYYQKNSPAGVAVILVTFDRTAQYSTAEDDMDFIALAAHELRGPITVIRGYLDVFKNDLSGSFNADQRELFDRLLVSSERLAGYVNNILNVSRYDRKQFQVHLHEEDLLTMLKTLAPDLGLRARTQRRTLIFRIPQGLPSIAADSSSLGEVITNLIDNAIKYSHAGGEIIVTAAPKDGNAIEITVQDHGIGMPGSVVGGLFSKFYRSHRSRQAVGGTGLGLYICKAIVEAHGGSIWVRAKEGEGSTFGFTVPTYASVAAKLQQGAQNAEIVERPEGWIKNHAMYRR